MGASEWTSIILGVLTLLGGCGWFVEGRKHREATRVLNADYRLKNMELGQIYVEQFEKNIADPLRQEVRELRKEVKELKDAVESINDCPYRTECPVRDRMRQHAKRE